MDYHTSLTISEIVESLKEKIREKNVWTANQVVQLIEDTVSTVLLHRLAKKEAIDESDMSRLQR